MLGAAFFLFARCAVVSAQEKPDGPVAQEEGVQLAGLSPSTWDVRLEVDLPLTLLAAVGASSWLLGEQLQSPHCAPVCDRSTLWGIDRGAAGQWDTGWKTASDLGVGVVLVGSLATLAVDRPDQSIFLDGLVMVQTVLVTNSMSSLFGLATRRPRPHVYGDDSPLEDRLSGTAALSFFSGHTANSFAAVTALFWTLKERHPGDAWPWVVWGVGILGSSFVGLGRVLAGQHFPTDTLAGAVVGIGAGIAIPELHRRSAALRPLACEGGAGLQWTGRW